MDILKGAALAALVFLIGVSGVLDYIGQAGAESILALVRLFS